MCCTYCDCRKLYGLGNFADFSIAGVAWFEEHAVTSNDYMATLPTAGPPLLPRTYGCDLLMLLVDLCIQTCLKFCKDHCITHSQKLFTSSLLGVASSMAWPEFKGKP